MYAQSKARLWKARLRKHREPKEPLLGGGEGPKQNFPPRLGVVRQHEMADHKRKPDRQEKDKRLNPDEGLRTKNGVSGNSCSILTPAQEQKEVLRTGEKPINTTPGGEQGKRVRTSTS